MLVLASGALSDESEDDAGLPSVLDSETPSMVEEELAPALDSNRQPIEPDPLVLPQWGAGEAGAMAAGRPTNLGGGLWTAERYPLQPIPTWPAPPASSMPVPAGPLGWDLLSLYGATREWCVDPQGLLDASRRARVETHLSAHARSAAHPVRLWVLASGQSVAAVLDDDTLHRATFGPDQPGVLVVVADGNPLNARLVLPPTLAARTPAWRGTVVAGIDPLAGPADQLDQLVLWLTLETESLPTPRSLAGAATLNAAPTPIQAGSRPIISIQTGGWLGLAAAAATAMAWRRRRRAKRTEETATPVLWQQVDRPMRLGGPHSGGSGAVIEW